MRSIEEKIYDRNELAQQIKKWQDEGYIVAMTNGCFDVLHVGHLRYLMAMKDHCDKLVVAVNSDNSVSSIKGPNRPINDELSRVQMLAGFECTDAIVLFDEPTASNVLLTVKPDLYVKGGDYDISSIPEGVAVLSYGGRIMSGIWVEGHSSTRIIEKMKKLKDGEEL